MTSGCCFELLLDDLYFVFESDNLAFNLVVLFLLFVENGLLIFELVFNDSDFSLKFDFLNFDHSVCFLDLIDHLIYLLSRKQFSVFPSIVFLVLTHLFNLLFQKDILFLDKFHFFFEGLVI